VNTPSDETSPSLSPDDRELYFCSNRPGGCGEYDIWVVRSPLAGLKGLFEELAGTVTAASSAGG